MESVSANPKPYVSPELIVTSPLPDSLYRTSEVQLNVKITLFGYQLGGIVAEGLSWLNYSVDGHAGHEMPIVSLPNDLWPNPVLNGTGDMLLSGLSEGRHWVEVYGETSFNITFSSGLIFFNVDAVAPSISFLMSVQNATYPLGEVPVGFVVSEPTSNLSYCLDGRDNVTVDGNFTLTDLANGFHNLTLYAWDSIGNVGTSETITFTVDKQPESTSNPEPLPLLPVAAVTLAVAAVLAAAAVVYQKKRRR